MHPKSVPAQDKASRDMTPQTCMSCSAQALAGTSDMPQCMTCLVSSFHKHVRSMLDGHSTSSGNIPSYRFTDLSIEITRAARKMLRRALGKA